MLQWYYNGDRRVFRIANNARLMYKQKVENDTTAGYVKSALNYKKSEKIM